MEVSRGEEWSSKGMDGCPLKNTTSWLYHYWLQVGWAIYLSSVIVSLILMNLLESPITWPSSPDITPLSRCLDLKYHGRVYLWNPLLCLHVSRGSSVQGGIRDHD
jgi:hypothetical protein